MVEFACELLSFEGKCAKQLNSSSTRKFWTCEERGSQELNRSGLHHHFCKRRFSDHRQIT